MCEYNIYVLIFQTRSVIKKPHFKFLQPLVYKLMTLLIFFSQKPNAA